jgi:spore coat assemly protein
LGGDERMQIGDIVVRKSYKKDVTFKVIDIKETEKGESCTLKGINLRILADSLADDLELVSENSIPEGEQVFSKQVNSSIKKILMARDGSVAGGTRSLMRSLNRSYRIQNMTQTNNELKFGRPGKILHIDGDADYLNVCLKVYKQLSLEVVGKMIPEKEQPQEALELVKQVRPDIAVITGHDAVSRGTKDYMDIGNYRNSKYFVETVTALRSYNSNYDDLVIYAGACQSCYEAILDAGANFASSPNRVLIHCLDPVFLCEKIAYTNIEKVVSIQEALENTITGIKGIGGLQTRGKYREGFPKSPYA